MGKVRDFFWKDKEIIPSLEVFDGRASRSTELVDYAAKDSRAEKVTYDGIGKNTYSSGMPPQIYTDPLTAFTSYPIVTAVVTAISDAGAGMSAKVFAVKGGQKSEVPDHIFYQIFKSPNPYEGSFEFMEKMLQSLDIFGNCFISKEKVAGTFELYVLNPQYVGIIPDPKTKIKLYRYYINGQSVDYKPEEIIHIKYANPSDPYFGLPPLAPAADVLTFEKNRLSFANQYFINGAIPVGVVETEQVLGESVLKSIRGDWVKIHQGVANSHKVGILQGGLKYRPITSPIKELDFPGLKKMSKDDILAIYKVPESILGSQDGTGASEGKSAITAFWRSCVIPRLKRIESAINRGLSVDVFGQGSFVFEFDLSDVVALQDTKTDTASYLSSMVSSSIMTLNEARAAVGLPALPDDFANQPLISNSAFGNSLMPVSEIGNQGAGSTTTKPAATPSGTTNAATPAKPTKKPTPTEEPAKPAKPKKEDDSELLLKAAVFGNEVNSEKLAGLIELVSAVAKAQAESDRKVAESLSAITAKMSEGADTAADIKMGLVNANIDNQRVIQNHSNATVGAVKAIAERPINITNPAPPPVEVNVTVEEKSQAHKVVKNVVRDKHGALVSAEIAEVGAE